MTTNDVGDCINLLVRIVHVICNHPVYSVKLSLCLTKHHAIKAYWGVDV
jgi:hypothetical protein